MRLLTLRRSFVASLGVAFLTAAAVPALADDQPATQQGQPSEGQPSEGEAKKGEPVDFRKLKECLPETLAGIKRTNSTGQKTKYGEMTLSNAEGTYGESGEENAKYGKLVLLDYGNTDMASALAIWANTDIDQESDDEYTKTVTVQGVKGMLTYNKKDKRGSLQMAPGGRIMLNLELNGISDDELKKAVDELPVKKLVELAKA